MKSSYNIRPLVLPILTLSCATTTGYAVPKSDDIKKPNVVFIICDDLNDYEGAFAGHKQAKTPNIDKLSKSGVTFINAHSNCPVSAPSRNSLFTGVYTHTSKDFGWISHEKQEVLKNNKTMSDIFKENDYQVMGAGKLLHFENHSVWDEWGTKVNLYGPYASDGTKPVAHSSVPKPFSDIGPIDGSFGSLADIPSYTDSITKEKKGGWVYDWGKKSTFKYIDENNRDLMPDEIHAQWAVKRLSEMSDGNDDQPFFMAIGFNKPHTPLHAPQKYFDMYPLDKIELNPIKKGDVDDTYYKDIYPADSKGLWYYRDLLKSYNGNEEVALKHFLQAYLACVTFVDDQIGKVIDAIDNSKFKENTIIVLTSDHGWDMGEKEYLFKNSPWEKSTRIPYIIRWSGGEKGTKVDHPVSLIDLYPTLTDLCGLKGDNRKNDLGGTIGGYSLKPFLLDSQTTTWQGPNGALAVIGVGLNKKDVDKQTYSYRTKDWRYIFYMDGSEELYHNKVDPYEWINVANKKENKSIKNQLKKEMLDLIQKTGK